MKRLLPFVLLLLFAGLAPMRAQQTLACDLNLPNNLPDVTSECSIAFADLTIPAITDSCNNVITPTTDQSIFPISTMGTTTITWTYQDAQGNFDSQTQDITIFDFTDPVPDVLFLPDIISECQLAEADVPVPTGTDNCSTVVTVTHNAVFPITAQGTTTIVWTYADASGNTTSRLQDVIIHDFVDPVPDVTVLPDIIVECEATAGNVPIPTATDNCSGVIVGLTNAAFPIGIPGTYTIIWTYSDGAGNVTSQPQDIIIHDFIEPVPDVAVLTDIISECQLLEADVIAPTATDNCSAVTVTNDAVFPITTPGTSVITWTYTDEAGNFTTQIQDVIIFDFTDPVPDAVILADVVSSCPVLQTDLSVPTATDNCSGIVMVTNNAVFPIFAPGADVTWTYTDASGNTTTQIQHVIVAADGIAPVPDVAVLPAISVQCSLADTDVAAPTASDNCSVVSVTNDAVFPITAQGTTTITWTYTDASGNTATQTQEVTIADVTFPTVTLTDLTVEVDVLGNAVFTAAQLENGTASDNCGVASVSVSPSSFTCEELGAHLVTVTVIDVNGNGLSTLATVTVTDPADHCGALGIAKNEKASFAVYPNPTSALLYIQPEKNVTIKGVKLYTVLGQLMQEINYTEKMDRYTVPMSPFAMGSYILKIATDNGTYTKQIIKTE